MIHRNICRERECVSCCHSNCGSIPHGVVFTTDVASQIIARQFDDGGVVVGIGSDIFIDRILSSSVCKPLEDIYSC